MHWGKYVRDARIRAGKSEEDAAHAAGLSHDNLLDLEGDATELFDNVSLGEARRLLTFVGLDIEDVVQQWIGPEQYAKLPGGNDAFHFRHKLLGDRLLDSSNEERIADEVGFDVHAIQLCARASDYFEGYPIRFAVDVAKAIGVNAAKFIKGP